MPDDKQSFQNLIFSKSGFILLSIILALSLIFIVRSCSRTPLLSPTYEIGVDDRWTSLNLMTKERNMTAFSNDLIRAIAKEQGFRYNLTFAPPMELLSRLDNRQLQGIFSAVLPTSTLQRRYLFSEPYFLFGPVLIVPKKSEFDSWEEARHKIIGILSQSGAIFELSQEQSIQLRMYENPLKALADLNNELIDGVVLPAIQAYIYVQTFYPDTFRIATTPLTREGYRLMVHNNIEGKELIEQFNAGLKAIRENGEYQQLVERWGIFNPEQVETQQR